MREILRASIGFRSDGSELEHGPRPRISRRLNVGRGAYRQCRQKLELCLPFVRLCGRTVLRASGAGARDEACEDIGLDFAEALEVLGLTGVAVGHLQCVGAYGFSAVRTED